ncbi:MAG TPA: MFS transporter [Candidatus Onthovicinus excrementipullorum]|nr:MFS transporter [Candidatus Onthovicinus excrementipullorum]
MRQNFKTTMIACFTGYVVQAIINNFVPLLFITLQNSYDIPLSKITMLVTINFAVQLIVDMIAAVFVDKIGYRISIVLAHIFSAGGLILLTVLPDLLPDAFTGILISVIVYAIGGGLIEVLISPIMESCPTENKESAMSLLHSFYCWGHVGVVLISTVFFGLVGIENWRILACVWAVIPVVNAVVFIKTPMAPLIAEGEKGMPVRELFRNKTFWFLMLLMLCAGASEQSVSQWASTFAESGLGVSKAVGDLAGPMAFAVLMGSARAFYGKYGEKINLDRFMIGSGLLCVFSYLLISLVPSPVFSLIGCALCGLSVGIMWPGSFSKAAASIRTGGTAMFAMLALAGDLGCSGGPTLVGLVSSAAGNNLKIGILAAVVFPILPVVGLLVQRRSREKHLCTGK